jgi:adenylate cyclase class 2
MPHPAGPTHSEIEIKLRVGDIRALLKRLTRIGAAARGRVFERNTLFDTPGADFRRCGCLLRVRVETPAAGHGLAAGPRGAVLTFKAPPENAGRKLRGGRRGAQWSGARRMGIRPPRYKERLERELPIQTPSAWLRLLRSIGLRPAFIYEKYRSTFVLGRLQLDLDETPAGVFLELEGSPPAIDRAAKALGYSPRDYFTGTYWDVYVTDCRRRGVHPRNCVFRGQKSA